MRHTASVALAFLAGCVVGIPLGHCEAFKFENKLTLGDVFGACAAIVIATLVYTAVGQLTDRKKFLLSFVADELQTIQKDLDWLDQFFHAASSSPQPKQECLQALGAFRSAINRTGSLKARLGILGFGPTAQAVCDELHSDLDHLRDVSTQVGFPVDRYRIDAAQLAQYRQCLENARDRAAQVVRELVA